MRKMYEHQLPRFLKLTLCAFFLSACAQQDLPDTATTAGRDVRLSHQDRQDLVPNELFTAVYNDDLAQVQRLITARPHLLNATNIRFGETPLAMALRLGNQALVMPMIRATHQKDHIQTNLAGESYLFLAARMGHLEMINHMVRELFLTHGSWDRFDMSAIDKPDKLGRRAHFVAKNSRIVASLHSHYRSGIQNSFTYFFNTYDNDGRTYLHWAAIENRDEVIAWTVREFCAKSTDSDKDTWSGISRFLGEATRGFAFWTGDRINPVGLFVNRQDTHSQTALHVAAANGSYRAIDALLSCPWLYSDGKDAQQQTALHLFLKRLDPRQTRQPDHIRSTFQRLVNFTSCHGPIGCYGKEHLIQIADPQKQMPSHIAAALNDPFFYEQLQAVRNILEPDARGRTPEQIRAETNRQIGQGPRP